MTNDRVDLAADGITPLWEHGPWSDDNEPSWIRVKDENLRLLYGLPIDWWLNLLDLQGWRCPGCRRTFRFHAQCPPGYPRPPHVDHDHDTGEIRGLLCGRCNRKLSQRLARYVLNPPARRLGPWVVPRKQRRYGMEVFAKRAQYRYDGMRWFAKRTQRQQLAKEVLDLTFGPSPDPTTQPCPNSTSSGP